MARDLHVLHCRAIHVADGISPAPNLLAGAWIGARAALAVPHPVVAARLIIQRNPTHTLIRGQLRRVARARAGQRVGSRQSGCTSGQDQHGGNRRCPWWQSPIPMMILAARCARWFSWNFWFPGLIRAGARFSGHPSNWLGRSHRCIAVVWSQLSVFNTKVEEESTDF